MSLYGAGRKCDIWHWLTWRGWVDGRKEGHMITNISLTYRLPFFLTHGDWLIIIIIIIITINNSIFVKISRLQSGRFFLEKRQRDNFARSAWTYVKKSQSLQTFRLTNRTRINLGKNTGSSAVNKISWYQYKQNEKTVSVVSGTNNKNDKPRLRFLPNIMDGLRTKQSGSLSRLQITIRIRLLKPTQFSIQFALCGCVVSRIRFLFIFTIRVKNWKYSVVSLFSSRGNVSDELFFSANSFNASTRHFHWWQSFTITSRFTQVAMVWSSLLQLCKHNTKTTFAPYLFRLSVNKTNRLENNSRCSWGTDPSLKTVAYDCLWFVVYIAQNICEDLLCNNSKKNRRDLKKENHNSIEHPLIVS